MDNQTPYQLPPRPEFTPPPKRTNCKPFVVAGIVGLIVVFVLIGLVVAMRQSVAPSQSATSIGGDKTQRYCYVRLEHLVCLGETDDERARYDLPTMTRQKIITRIVTNPTQTAYVAYSDNTNEAGLWLLNTDLTLNTEIAIPNGQTLSPYVSLTRDGKAVLLSLSGADGIGKLYRYDIATKAYSSLSTATSASMPFSLEGGRILYKSAQTNGARPYIMDADASNQHEVNGMAAVKDIIDFSYDQASDNVYVADQSQVYYGQISALENSQPVDTLRKQLTAAGFNIVKTDSNEILINSGTAGERVTLSTGFVVSNLKDLGQAVGFMSTAKLTPSKQQPETTYEAITGLNSAPTDLQTLLKQRYDIGVETCGSDPATKDKFRMSVRSVVRDSFANTTEGCDSGAVNYYVKTGGAWTQAFAAQNTPACDTVNRYAFTKEIIPKCSDAVGQLIANPNP